MADCGRIVLPRAPAAAGSIGGHRGLCTWRWSRGVGPFLCQASRSRTGSAFGAPVRPRARLLEVAVGFWLASMFLTAWSSAFLGIGAVEDVLRGLGELRRDERVARGHRAQHRELLGELAEDLVLPARLVARDLAAAASVAGMLPVACGDRSRRTCPGAANFM